MAASSSTAASSASTAADSNSNQWHQVFINHRGDDVKQTFAKSLYKRLGSIGLRAFLDEDELQVGYEFPPQIEQAIGTASVHVAILSPRYAESYWCLKELSLMLESHRENKVPIVPIFYGVTPAEVRRTQRNDGIYAQALKQLAEKVDQGKQRYDPNTIEKWRNALSDVADISGFVLEKCNIGTSNELERKLLENVVTSLSRMLEKPDLPVPDYKTALNYKLKDLEEKILLPQQQRGKPQILGIWGLGGVGKTTLAKHIFNRKKPDYHRSCHLLEVRDNVAKSSLQSLQSRLFKRLTGSEKHVNSVDEGKMMLKEPLQYYKALIILDDVHDASHVQALLPIKAQDLCSGSLILITCRHKDVLIGSRLVEESSIYKLTSLSEKHARELFCLHAFSQSDPLPGFEYLVDKFLKVCDGLPLSLKVFGARFFGKNDKSYWQDQLDRLQQIVPAEIQHRLKISFDSLNKEEQEMFLDIACFFIGENRDMVIRIWDGSGWKGLLGFQNLQNKCLVEVGSENDIHMHDHLRDLGKDIAEASRPPRRLCRQAENIDDLLHQSINEQGTTEVRGIRMLPNVYNDGSEHALLRSGISWYKMSRHVYRNRLVKLLHNTRFHGVRMRRLQLLDIEDEHLERILERMQSPNLIWLRY